MLDEGSYEKLQNVIIPWENMSSHPCSWGGGRVGFGPKDEGVRRGEYFLFHYNPHAFHNREMIASKLYVLPTSHMSLRHN